MKRFHQKKSQRVSRLMGDPGGIPGYFFFFFSIVISFCIVSGVAAAPPGPGGGPPPAVGVFPVRVQDINPPEEFVGHIEAVQAVDLRARVQGFLEKINFKEGEFVKAGKVLYVIEQAPYIARVSADKARIAQAKAELSRAERHLKRLRSARKESIPATDRDNAIAAELAARAKLSEAEASLKMSELNLQYTSIKAPISGRIGKTAYTKGNLVGPESEALARIVQVDPIRSVWSISENDLPLIRSAIKDAKAGSENPLLVPQIRLANGDIYPLPGRIDFVNNEVDAETGTISVRGVFPNPDGFLTPGQYVTVLMKKSAPEMLPVVPQEAVQQDHDGAFVFLVETGNKVAVKRIETGPVTGTLQVVKSGLSEGDKVIFQGIQKVRPGSVVQIAGEKKKGK